MANNAKKSAKKSNSTPARDVKTALAGLDMEAVGNTIRVYALAKQLDVTSRELTAELGELGLKKVAQSSLTREEVQALVDKQHGEKEAPKRKKARRGETATPEDEEKLRKRVRKNVENEIQQIEDKVEAKLAEEAASHEVESGEDGEGEEQITPEITPPPTESNKAAAAFVPLFVAPGTGDDDLEVDELKNTSPSRRSRRRTSRRAAVPAPAPTPAPSRAQEAEHEDPEPITEPVATKGSTRLEAQRRRRTEMREAGRKRKHIVSQAEFLARRESVERTMVVRERARHDGPGHITQVGVLEDELLVEHFVTSEAQASMIGNIYLGRVQNVLASMEAAFIDIGTGRNGVLYASEVDWKNTGSGSGRSRKIEHVLKSGDQVLVQVSKDPLGHKGPRLTTQISLAGRYLVYVPNGRSAGISRKLPAPERKRLKDILGRVIPGHGGAIIRTAAENVSEEAIGADVKRLHDMWEDISQRADEEMSTKGAKPVTLYEEPDLLVKVVRDLFNEDFTRLVIDGKRAWNTVSAYINSVAPDLADRLERFHGDGEDAFEHYRIDEQIKKALARKVWLPSGGYLIIEQTEAMVVIDVNTGKFTGSGGNLEETVTSNNLEAAEEIVRQMRLRDLGGMIVVDFIDMVLPENQDLVLRRLKEALGRDRTRHQVSEVTSLGLVQITRKRLGTGLVETFATECEHCGGRGLILHDDPVDEHGHAPAERHPERPAPRKRASGDELEKLADAVVSVADEADGADHAEDNKDTHERPRRSSRRRGRRGGGRGRGREQEEKKDSLSDVEKIAAAAVERAEELDPEEPSGADYVSDEKSFQEAVEDFERSPRRRRKTRGNSRSDRRPRREDFVTNQEPVETKPEERPAATPPAEETTPATQTRPRSRGRRRVVRRLSAAAAPEPKASQREEKSVEKRDETRSRGRRRATRRSVRRG